MLIGGLSAWKDFLVTRWKMIEIRKCALIATATIAVLCTAAGNAYNIREHTLREKVDASDVVANADVMNKPSVVKSDPDQYIWVKPKIVLQANPRTR
jgi:hypothetical protein